MDYMQQPNQPYGQPDLQGQMASGDDALPQPLQVPRSQYGAAQPQYQVPTQPQYQQPMQPQYQVPVQSQPQYQAPPSSQYGQPAYDFPPAQPYASPQPMIYVHQKSKLAAGLLGIFLGCFGAHNFYLGNYGKAIAQLLLTLLLGWVFGIGAIAAGIWGLVEAILILSSFYGSRWHRDANGVELRD